MPSTKIGIASIGSHAAIFPTKVMPLARIAIESISNLARSTRTIKAARPVSVDMSSAINVAVKFIVVFHSADQLLGLRLPYLV